MTASPYEAVAVRQLRLMHLVRWARIPFRRKRSARAPRNFVRVDLARLDDLMRLVGDMVVSRARLADTLERVEAHVPFREWRALQEHNAGLERPASRSSRRRHARAARAGR
jgi:chemotaxis protein histidine kinase CheA